MFEYASWPRCIGFAVLSLIPFIGAPLMVYFTLQDRQIPLQMQWRRISSCPPLPEFYFTVLCLVMLFNMIWGGVSGIFTSPLNWGTFFLYNAGLSYLIVQGLATIYICYGELVARIDPTNSAREGAPMCQFRVKDKIQLLHRTRNISIYWRNVDVKLLSELGSKRSHTGRA